MDAVHIVGVGGIGCAVGHTLRRAGVRVVCVEASDAKIASGRSEGLGVDRAPRRSAEFVRFDAWEPPREGVVLLCTKGPANAAVLARVPASASLVPIQNGIDPQLAERAPFAEGVASFVSESEPGRTHTRITRPGALHLGVHGTPTPALRDLVTRLGAALSKGPVRVKIVGDILPFKHTKLMYNAAIGPIASAAGLDNGELLRLPYLRSLFFGMLRENHAILCHAGLPLGKVGPLAPATVAGILARPWLAHALAWAFYPSLRGTYCSMARDLPGGPTEIDHYNGRLIAMAGDFPCPLNRAVYALIRRMEEGNLLPSPARIDELQASLVPSGT